MTDTSLQLVSSLGLPIGTLRIGALTLAAKAEEVARNRHLAKRTALPLVLREYLESAGYEVGEAELAVAVDALEKVRRGEALPAIQIRVGSHADYQENGLAHSNGKHHSERKREPMVATLD